MTRKLGEERAAIEEIVGMAPQAGPQLSRSLLRTRDSAASRALGCASRLLWLAKKRGPDFTIPYVFDQGPKGQWAFAAFERLLSRKNYYRMGSLSKGNRHLMLPLQAADLHAYEVYKYFANQLAQSGRAARGSFCELLKIAHCGGYLMVGDKLEMLTCELKRQELSGSIGPIGIPIDVLDAEHGIRLHPPLPPGLTEPSSG